MTNTPTPPIIRRRIRRHPGNPACVSISTREHATPTPGHPHGCNDTHTDVWGPDDSYIGHITTTIHHPSCTRRERGVENPGHHAVPPARGRPTDTPAATTPYKSTADAIRALLDTHERRTY